jgi:superoxide dismutase, Fe-Mn family
MTIEVRPLIFKPQYLNGLTEKLMVSHYENNYGGALRRLNAIEARMRTLDWATAPVFEINGLKREELIAAGSVILHEVYFDSLWRRGWRCALGIRHRGGPGTRLRQRCRMDIRVYRDG